MYHSSPQLIQRTPRWCHAWLPWHNKIQVSAYPLLPNDPRCLAAMEKQHRDIPTEYGKAQKTKPKRVLSEKQLETLALARVKAAEVKKKNKEEKLKALSLSKKENEIKAIEYDKLEEKKKQLLEPKTVKKTTKKVVAEEEETDGKDE